MMIKKKKKKIVQKLLLMEVKVEIKTILNHFRQNILIKTEKVIPLKIKKMMILAILERII